MSTSTFSCLTAGCPRTRPTKVIARPIRVAFSGIPFTNPITRQIIHPPNSRATTSTACCKMLERILLIVFIAIAIIISHITTPEIDCQGVCLVKSSVDENAPSLCEPNGWSQDCYKCLSTHSTLKAAYWLLCRHIYCDGGKTEDGLVKYYTNEPVPIIFQLEREPHEIFPSSQDCNFVKKELDTLSPCGQGGFMCRCPRILKYGPKVYCSSMDSFDPI